MSLFECRECGWIGMYHETDHELCPECGGELVECEDDDDDQE